MDQKSSSGRTVSLRHSIIFPGELVVSLPGRRETPPPPPPPSPSVHTHLPSCITDIPPLFVPLQFGISLESSFFCAYSINIADETIVC